MRPIVRRDIPAAYGAGKATPADAASALAKALIGQVRTGTDYTAQRRYWLRKARGWSAQGWDERLPAGGHALWLAPVAPASAARHREHPKPVGVPGFITFDEPMTAESALAVALTVWLEQVAARDFDAVTLAPPILERYVQGRLVRCEVVDYGLTWPLAAQAS